MSSSLDVPVRLSSPRNAAPLPPAEPSPAGKARRRIPTGVATTPSFFAYDQRSRGLRCFFCLSFTAQGKNQTASLSGSALFPDSVKKWQPQASNDGRNRVIAVEAVRSYRQDVLSRKAVIKLQVPRRLLRCSLLLCSCVYHNLIVTLLLFNAIAVLSLFGACVKPRFCYGDVGISHTRLLRQRFRPCL